MNSGNGNGNAASLANAASTNAANGATAGSALPPLSEQHLHQ